MVDDSKRAGPCRWRAVAPAGLLFQFWPVDVAVFNAGTGETHLVSELPAYVLGLLRERPWPEPVLCAELAVACGLADDALWRERCQALLADLAALDLIEPVPDIA